MKILITGGTGFIGRHLVNTLAAGGNEIIVVTRNAESAKRIFPKSVDFVMWDNLDSVANRKFDCIINLAGKNLNEQRWNKKVKKQLYDSRINPTRRIVEFIKSASPAAGLLINASGVDYYGDTGDKDIHEDFPPADSFVSQLTKDWEAEALKARELGVRVVVLRTGFVIAKDSNAFKKMVLPFKIFAGGYAGGGNQYLSWIHIEDLLRVYRFVIDNKQIQGAVNACSPHPVRMKKFARCIGKTLHRPWFFPAPQFLLRILFGEVAVVLISGRKALPKKLQDSGFEFKYENAHSAVKDSL